MNIFNLVIIAIGLVLVYIIASNSFIYNLKQKTILNLNILQNKDYKKINEIKNIKELDIKKINYLNDYIKNKLNKDGSNFILAYFYENIKGINRKDKKNYPFIFASINTTKVEFAMELWPSSNINQANINQVNINQDKIFYNWKFNNNYNSKILDIFQ